MNFAVALKVHKIPSGSVDWKHGPWAHSSKPPAMSHASKIHSDFFPFTGASLVATFFQVFFFFLLSSCLPVHETKKIPAQIIFSRLLSLLQLVYFPLPNPPQTLEFPPSLLTVNVFNLLISWHQK